MSLPERSDGGWVLDAVKGPIRPDLGPLARDRTDLTFRWVSLRDLDDFSMQGIRP
jgi:hypothetical protein